MKRLYSDMGICQAKKKAGPPEFFKRLVKRRMNYRICYIGQFARLEKSSTPIQQGNWW
jgi:hypothetical protein